ncbi:MAG TPA: hypothetical protein VND62_04730 [Acidimicrobiales bacterium]|nr:hypothetical protein [Acidimicrobiales bacterium]
MSIFPADRYVAVMPGGVPFESAARPTVEDYRALLRDAEELLDGVDRALGLLDSGTYGACDVCGASIADGDLEEDPVRTRCPAHPARG